MQCVYKCKQVTLGSNHGFTNGCGVLDDVDKRNCLIAGQIVDFIEETAELLCTVLVRPDIDWTIHLLENLGELHHHSVVQSAQRALDRENSSEMVADHNWSHKVQMLTGTWFAAYFKLFLGTALFSANALHGLVHVRIIRTDGNSVSKSRFA